MTILLPICLLGWFRNCCPVALQILPLLKSPLKCEMSIESWIIQNGILPIVEKEKEEEKLFRLIQKCFGSTVHNKDTFHFKMFLTVIICLFRTTLHDYFSPFQFVLLGVVNPPIETTSILPHQCFKRKMSECHYYWLLIANS